MVIIRIVVMIIIMGVITATTVIIHAHDGTAVIRAIVIARPVIGSGIITHITD